MAYDINMYTRPSRASSIGQDITNAYDAYSSAKKAKAKRQEKLQNKKLATKSNSQQEQLERFPLG